MRICFSSAKGVPAPLAPFRTLSLGVILLTASLLADTNVAPKTRAELRNVLGYDPAAEVGRLMVRDTGFEPVTPTVSR